MPEHPGAYVPEPVFRAFGPPLLQIPAGMQVAPPLMQTKIVRSVNIGEKVLRRGIENPLEIARFISFATQILAQHEYTFFYSSDLKEFADVKREARNSEPSPMFDYRLGQLGGKAFWVGIRDTDGNTLGSNAYRLDFIDTNLSDWVTGWMSGLYMKAGLLMVPEKISPGPFSRACNLTGHLCYHGELWVHKAVRGPRYVNEAMTLAGHMIALLKWQPLALWALVDQRVGGRGTGILNGYPYAERSFLEWEWRPDEIAANEWLLVVEASELEQIARDRLTHGLMSKPT